MSDAKNFCDSLGNVFMMKKRDPQTRHLLEQAKTLIEGFMRERRRADKPAIAPKPSRGGGTGSMGQLWMKLDELKRENDELRSRRHGSKPHEDKSSSGRSGTGPGDVIIADLHKTRLECETLEQKLQKAETTIKEMEKVNASLREEFKKSKILQDMAQASLEKIKKEQQTLESSLNSVKTENDTLKKRLTNSVKPMMRTDNKNVENINERCRPSNIAILYNNLESQEWVDAKESLEDAGFDDEVTITKFLCSVLMACYSASQELLQSVEASVAHILKDPTCLLTNSVIRCGAKQLSLPEEITSSIKEVLRDSVGEFQAETVANDCRQMILSEELPPNFKDKLSSKPLARYMEQCAHITWQMTIQNTPMILSVAGSEFDDAVHKLWWSCNQSGSRKIDFFVWPALYDFQNGNLMVKGCVYTK